MDTPNPIVQYANGYITQAPTTDPVQIRTIFGQRLDFLELSAKGPRWAETAADAARHLTANPTQQILMGGYFWTRIGQNQNWDHILRSGNQKAHHLTLKINHKTRAYHPNLIAIEYPGETLTLWQGSRDLIEKPWHVILDDAGVIDADQHTEAVDTLCPTRSHVKADFITEQQIVMAHYGMDARLPFNHPGQFDRIRSKARAHNVRDTLYLHAMGASSMLRVYNKTMQCWEERLELPGDINGLDNELQQETRDTLARRCGRAWYHRAEWQLQREYLHTHGWDAWGNFKRDLDGGKVWRTAMQGNDVIEPTQKNPTRCPVAEWWQQIKDSWKPGDTTPQIPPPPDTWEKLAKARACIDARITAKHMYETGKIIHPHHITYGWLDRKCREGQQAAKITLAYFVTKLNDACDKLQEYSEFHHVGNMLGLCYSQPAVGIPGSAAMAAETPETS